MAQSKLGRSKVTHAGRLPLNIAKDMVKNKYLYMMLTPVLLYFIIFHYFPMYGSIIAFKDFNPGLESGAAHG